MLHWIEVWDLNNNSKLGVIPDYTKKEGKKHKQKNIIIKATNTKKKKKDKKDGRMDLCVHSSALSGRLLSQYVKVT